MSPIAHAQICDATQEGARNEVVAIEEVQKLQSLGVGYLEDSSHAGGCLFQGHEGVGAALVVVDAQGSRADAEGLFDVAVAGDVGVVVQEIEAGAFDACGCFQGSKQFTGS